MGANEFDDPRVAALYDVAEGARPDLDAYVEIVDELGATSVVDIGCGTGELACRLATLGLNVQGVDPAAEMLAVARMKPAGDRVRWVHGTAGDLTDDGFDLAVMTGNVAQVFLADDEWARTLRAAASGLRPDGHLVFETRDPTRRAWEGWTPEFTRASHATRYGEVEIWCDVIEVDEPFVSFRWTHEYADGVTTTSDSTLRFRTRDELDGSLGAAGFDVVEVRDAPDRPGLEWVYIARRR